MEIIQTNIPGILIIEPRVFKDSCGYFFENFSQREFDEQTNEARAESSVLELCLAIGGRPRVRGYAYPWAKHQFRTIQ